MNRNSIQTIKSWKLLAAVLAIALLTACGGGGGGGDEVARPSAPPPSVGPTVTGSVTKGPVNGASVQFFDIDGRGNAVGVALASTTTDINGAFSITLPSGTGTVLVVTGGGSFIDESDQEPNIEAKRQIQLASNQGFTSILVEGASVVAINPYTHALVARARFLSETLGGFLGLFTSAKDILDAQAGFDVLSTIPANPTAPAVDATVAQKQYALLLGGLANAINKVSIQLGQSKPTYDVIIAVSVDFVDGTLDGRVFGEPISIGTATSSDPTATDGGPLLPSNIILNTEITRFRNNNFANYDGIAIPSIETTLLSNIDVPTLLGALPNPFFIADDDAFGALGVGNDFDGGAKVTINDDGTATVLGDFGTIVASFIIIGDAIRFDFPAGFVQDDFDAFIDVNDDGVREQFLAEEILVSLELTLAEDLINFDVLNTRAIGFTRYSGVDTTLTRADEPFDVLDRSLAFDYARQTPFNITADYQRTLLFNATPQFPEKSFPDELSLDEFAFDVDGTGLTLNNNIAFTWSVNADGHLSVGFANGESAEYYHLDTRASGDIISTEYTLNVALDSESGALLIGDAELSFLKDNADPLPSTLADAAGIYGGLTDIGETRGIISFRLNPDGTGILEFDFNDDGREITRTSVTGICWSINADKSLSVDRVNGHNGLFFSGSIPPNSSFCSDPNRNTFFNLQFTQYDIEGDTYKFLRTVTAEFCDAIADPGCTPTVTTFSFSPLILNRQRLSSVPPLLQDDSAVIPPGGSITIDVLVNDVARGLAIDASSVVIDKGPFDGNVSVNASTGAITYTANEFTEGDIVQYRVRDTAGNLSTIGTLRIEVNPPPQIPADQFVPVRSQVTLGAPGNINPANITSFNWDQISGPQVSLNNDTSANPSFFAPESGSLTTRSVIKFQLTTVDNQGVTAINESTIVVLAPVPQNSFSYHLFNPPFQFSSQITGGQIVFLGVDGTGAYQDTVGIFAFNWFESQGTLTLDFNGTGDFPIIENNFFADTDGDGFEEEILQTSTITSFEYRLSISPDDPNLLSRTQLGRIVEFNLTLNFQVFDNPTDFTFGQTMASIDSNLPFDIVDGQTLSLQTNISGNFPQIFAGDAPVFDELTFNSDGTGSAKRKGSAFTWETDVKKRLAVTFPDGEFVFYSLLDRLSGSDVVGVEYVYPSGNIKTTVRPLLTQDPAINWVAADLGGIYQTVGRSILNDGTEIPRLLFYRMHPDGRGVLELENFDFETGDFLGISTSGFGVCWELNSAGNFVWSRTFTRDQLIPGTSLPTLSHCGALTNDQVFFRRESVLFDINSEGQLRTIVENEQNFCLFSGDPNCDATILETNSFFHRVLDRIPLTNNPPLPVPDDINVNSGSSAVINVLLNDMPGDVAIDATTVVIIKNPDLGTVSVDPNTGSVTYTAGSVSGSDFFQYRVRDINGNLSTYGQVTINVSGVTGLSSLSFPDTSFGSCVVASGATSVDQLTTLSCDNLGINDLSGLEQLTSLTVLSINSNNLTSIDLTQNPQLQVVSLQVNQLTSVNLSNSSALRTLDLSTNQLSFVDLSGAPLLEILALDRNQFTSINLINTPNLTSLSMIDNQLANVDLSQLPRLLSLNLGGNLLTSIDLSANTQITLLAVNSNSLTAIDLSGMPNLVELELDENQFMGVNVNGNPLLVVLDLGSNNISTVSVDLNLLLEELLVENNQLTFLDVTANTALTSLDITMNAGFTCSNIQQIQDEHPNLTDFRFDENCDSISAITFPDLNLSSCVSATGATFVGDLTTLSCNSFGISNASGVEQLISLTSLELKNNSISSINVAPLTALTTLNLFDNQITSIDVSNNPLLTTLDVFTNQISVIDLSNNPLLTLLGLGDNLFTAVDLSVQVNLQQLFLSDNMLTNLNLTANTALTSVDINNNPGISCDDIATIQAEHPALSLTFNESCPL